MRYVVSSAALVGAAGMVLAAGWMNWRYMSSLASDANDRLALGAASIAIDVMKAALAYLIALAWDRRQWAYVGLASVSYLLLAIVSFASLLGFGSDRGDAIAMNRDSVAARYVASTKELAEIETKLKGYESVKASAVVESEIAALEGSPRWRATKSCSVIKGAGNAAFCASLSEKRVELARAKATESLEARRAELRTVITELVARGAKRDGGHAQFVASLNLREGRLRHSLLALVLELGAGLGVYLALRPVTGNVRKGRNESARDDEAQMPLARTERAPTAAVARKEGKASEGPGAAQPNGTTRELSSRRRHRQDRNTTTPR